MDNHLPIAIFEAQHQKLRHERDIYPHLQLPEIQLKISLFHYMTVVLLTL